MKYEVVKTVLDRESNCEYDRAKDFSDVQAALTYAEAAWKNEDLVTVKVVGAEKRVLWCRT